MEWLENIKVMWETYSPIILGVVASIGGVVGAGLVIWNKIQPLFEKLKELGNKVDDVKNSAASLSPLEIISTNTMITDLKAKLENPTIPDSLKLQFQEQLFQLEKLLSVVDSATDKATETVDKF